MVGGVTWFRCASESGIEWSGHHRKWDGRGSGVSVQVWLKEIKMVKGQLQ